MPNDVQTVRRPVDGASVPSSAASPPELPAAGGSVGLLNALLLIVMVSLAGITPVAAKDALDEMPPIAMGVLRFSIASTLLFFTVLVWQPKGRAPMRNMPWRDVGSLLLAAFLCVPVNQMTFLMGVQQANASHAALLYALNPVLIFMITVALGRVSFSRRMLTATVLAFVGAGVIGWEGLRGDVRFFRGDLLLFFAVLSWAVYSVVTAPLSAKYGPVRVLAFVMVIGTVVYSPAILLDLDRLDLPGLSWRAWLGFGVITIGTSYFNYMLWFVGMVRMDLNRLAVAVNAAPIIGVMMGYYWRDEPITRWLAIGAVLILTAITMANWDKFKALARRRTSVPG